MSDNRRAPGAEKLGRQVLALFLRQTEKKLTHVDVGFYFFVSATEALEAIAWLYEKQYIKHNDRMVCWDSGDVTDTGREACEQPAMNKVG